MVDAEGNYFRSTCEYCAQTVEVPSELYNRPVACPTCSKEFIALPRSEETQLVSTYQTTVCVPPPLIPMAVDVEFMREGGILITKTRFVALSQTFAMSGITSVKGVKTLPSRGGLIFLLILGLFVMLGSVVLGAFLVVPAIVFLVLQKPTFSILITTAGGEVAAYYSKNWQFIARAVNAVNEAIIARG